MVVLDATFIYAIENHWYINISSWFVLDIVPNSKKKSKPLEINYPTFKPHYIASFMTLPGLYVWMNY